MQVVRNLGFLHTFEGDPEDEHFDKSQGLPPILVDNMAALQVSRMRDHTKKTKHYMLRYAAVKDWGKSFSHVPTDLNL